jgi:hypothetical protein
MEPYVYWDLQSCVILKYISSPFVRLYVRLSDLCHYGFIDVEAILQKLRFESFQEELTLTIKDRYWNNGSFHIKSGSIQKVEASNNGQQKSAWNHSRTILPNCPWMVPGTISVDRLM